MPLNRWRIVDATGEFLEGGFYEPATTTGQSLVILPDESMPDRRTERYDDTVPSKRRAATGAEITSWDTAQHATRFTTTSRQKDVLATCAEIVRARGIAAWNAMTLQQKKDATLAEADVWVNIRNFIEDNI